MRKLLSVLITLVSVNLYNVYCQDNESDKIDYSHYDVRLKINPIEQFISVTGSLKYLVLEDTLPELTLSLHNELKMNKFSVNGDSSYSLDTSKSPVRWIPEMMKIIYPARKKFKKGGILDIEFSYQGKVTKWPEWSANVIGEDWVEMGLYFPWYPAISGDFTYKLTVEISEGYNVFALGTSSTDGNMKIFETDFPVYDFIICASKDLKIRKLELLNQPFQIVNGTLSKAVIDSMQTDIENCYKFYSTLFGEIEVQNMSLVISKREKGGGYSRKGGLFLGGMKDSSYLNKRIDYVKYIAHEISHFWWTGAPGNWEDWLNESFAEYSALLLIRKLYGEKECNSLINKKKGESKDTPPIWEIRRNDPDATKVLYSKGVILLSELEKKIGMERFSELCKERINKKVNNTKDFLNLINYMEGEKIAEWFEKELKTR